MNTTRLPSDLPRNDERVGKRHRTRADHVRKRSAFDQLEDEIPVCANLLDAEDLADVLMMECREHLRLALESHDTLGVIQQRVGERLARDVSIEPRIARPIDLAHAARAEPGDDFVRADVWAKHQRHGRRTDLTRRPSV